jgi:hypothetical protein
MSFKTGLMGEWARILQGETEENSEETFVPEERLGDPIPEYDQSETAAAL